MRLYDTQRSGNAWKVRLFASLLGIELERVTLSIDKGDLGQASFLARNPLAQVPVLELDDGRTISESFAILFYLARGTPWWPAEPFAQAQVLTWLSFEQALHMRPIAQLRLHLSLRRDKSASDAGPKPSTRSASSNAPARAGTGALGRHRRPALWKPLTAGTAPLRGAHDHEAPRSGAVPAWTPSLRSG